jgi:hypothetical protein
MAKWNEITEMERMTTISLVDHFMTDMITHRFSLTTLDNDIADHGALILIINKKISTEKSLNFEKIIDYEALEKSEGFAALDETQDLDSLGQSLLNLVRTFTKVTKLKKKFRRLKLDFTANPPQI